MVRVLIADDHRLFAEALRAILGAEPSVDVVGLAASGVDAVRQSAELEPDVVLMDISMPDLDGLEATRRILAKRPQTQVLMVTGSDARQDVDAAPARRCRRLRDEGSDRRADPRHLRRHGHRAGTLRPCCRSFPSSTCCSRSG